MPESRLAAIFAATFGTSLGNEVRRTIETTSDARLADFLERYRAEPRSPSGTRQTPELAPYLSTTIDIVESHIGLLMGTSGAAHGVGSLALGKTNTVAMFKPLLLYVHRVAVDDPIDGIYMGSGPDEFRRKLLADVLDSILSILPLIESDTVTLVPRAKTERAVHIPEDEVERLANALDFGPLKHALLGDVLKSVLLEHLDKKTASVDTVIEVLMDVYDGTPLTLWDDPGKVGELLREITTRSIPPSNWVKQAFDSFEATYRALHYREDLDFYFPYPYYEVLYDKWLRNVDITKATHPSEYLALIGQIELPALEALSLTDLIAIRRASGAFHEWRIALTKALDRAAGLSSEERRRPQIVREAFWDELAPGYQKVTAEVKNLGLGATARKLTRSFCVGSVSAIVAGASSGALEVGAASAALGAVAQTGSDILGARRLRRSNKVLQRHFVAFSPSGQ